LRQTCEFGPLQLFAVRDLQLGADTKNPCVIDPNKPAKSGSIFSFPAISYMALVISAGRSS
jgi:hypothetical protein